MMNKKLIVLMMLVAFSVTLNASNLASANPVAKDSHEEGCWLVALDKYDNANWIDLSYGHCNAYFSLYQYTNWNYYDHTGDLYVRTYFVIDGTRYIAAGGDFNEYSDNEEDMFNPVLSEGGYMQWYVGFVYQIYINLTYITDDYGELIEVPEQIMIDAQPPTGYWEDYLILKDKNGNEIAKYCGMSDTINVALDEATYGISDVYFHFRRYDGYSSSYTSLGAEVDGLAATPGVPYANKVVRNTTNNFKVKAGYHYKIGIFDDLFGYSYLYLLQGEPVGSSTTQGDANGDGNINMSDLTTVINYLLTNDTSGVNVGGADCNQDSNINMADVTALIGYLLTGGW